MPCSYHSITAIISWSADNKNSVPVLDWVDTIQGLAYGKSSELHQPVIVSKHQKGWWHWSMEKAPWDMRSLSRAAAAEAERNWIQQEVSKRLPSIWTCLQGFEAYRRRCHRSNGGKKFVGIVKITAKRPIFQRP